MNPIRDEQQRRNDQTRDSWKCFREHRTSVTRLLMQHADRRDSLCLFGAGNSNDVDLPTLLDGFAELHLVDIDATALRRGVDAQLTCPSDRLTLHGGVDLSFVGDELAAIAARGSDHPHSEQQIARCREVANRDPTDDLPGPFGVVGSLCLLTQLLESVELTLGAGHPDCLDLKLRVRACHLHHLLRSLRPGGHAVLILDFVSSATFPQLSKLPRNQLTDTAVRLINERNFFTGMNPFVIQQLFQSESRLAKLVDAISITPPWRWDFGPRSYLVCALVVRRIAQP